MTNPHCRPPVPFGKEQPDGSVVLDKAEAVWLRTVFSRIDTAQAEIAVQTFASNDPGFMEHVLDRLRDQVGNVSASAVMPEDMEVHVRTKKDEGQGVTRHRAKLTIIRGGLPPRAGF